MCFAPQPCALSRTQLPKGLQRWGALTFWLRDVLRATGATAASTFWADQLPKVLRTWGCFSHFDFEMRFPPQPRAVFSSRRWLCTRRFSEPTFQASGAPKHWKDTVLRGFSTFSRTFIFLLLTVFSLTLPTPVAASVHKSKFDFETSFDKYTYTYIYIYPKLPKAFKTRSLSSLKAPHTEVLWAKSLIYAIGV